MRLFIIFILSGLLVFLVVQMWYFYERGVAASGSLREFQAELEKAKREHTSLEADYEYYQNTANLEKELRGRFNYRDPDEKMIIIVPNQSSSSSTNP